MIKIVMRCPNDMVAVFDEHGQQIPKYQGHYDEVKSKILADAPADCKFETYSRDDFNLEQVDRGRW